MSTFYVKFTIKKNDFYIQCGPNRSIVYEVWSGERVGKCDHIVKLINGQTIAEAQHGVFGSGSAQNDAWLCSVGKKFYVFKWNTFAKCRITDYHTMRRGGAVCKKAGWMTQEQAEQVEADDEEM